MPTRVVVIEDEPAVLQMLQDFLQGNGYTVIPVPFPEMVYTIEPQLRPDLFLVDVMLPGMSGVELAQQLRASGFAHTPMIAMSASPLMLQVAAESKLFQGTLAKPFDLSNLLGHVSRFAA